MEAVDHSEAEKMVKEFDETKAGVKGIVDSGVTKIPRMFVHPPEESHQINKDHDLRVPTIDLRGLDQNAERRKQVISEISKAAGAWGFFQIVNHGVPLDVMEAVLKSVRRFHEQPHEAKADWYSRDYTKKVIYFSNGALKASTPADWRDTLSCNCQFLEDESNFQSLPQVCRCEIVEYYKHLSKLQEKLSELLSEALGLSSDYLSSLGCFKSSTLSCQYYPVCPEPHLTLGASKHSDIPFLTLLVQDNSGGLQVLHQNVWVDVPPLLGALVANIGDMMQITSNDKFKSVEHRVLATRVAQPRTSVACFFSFEDKLTPFGPLKELVSEINPPIYRDNIKFGEYIAYYMQKGHDGNSAIPHFRLVK
ncbi:1-aminocyclopropane-1-carboxylate oxidase homolog 1-like isoform X2 [Argentina anserina]|uniref:1-aminocyclopropane-1-carboxylate oxidase homolog 1-like isoform X2 n=1 Tax=Argentina anserina TaxID=57926 RepID=UPI0021764D79|nr:1-aminocyclopropane-1-carboxylate oxidase homolog 1-like isoform X2 [Potentilla anserina]